jgi:uncharacterized membrane protein
MEYGRGSSSRALARTSRQLLPAAAAGETLAEAEMKGVREQLGSGRPAVWVGVCMVK